ncbi:hypothetical protein [Candidatus Phyllobacterium onerii]|uniref:hypothetical protein n=1 Tax=Candidatus Phyllobacterium onerii TaxID=3020828 RepID=UPI0023303788|nr:hypothetical protein [Phyllobacterium sp. IY22]
MIIDTACQALREGKCLEVHYKGTTRIVEVHAAGVKKDQHQAVFGWQLRNMSKINDEPDWRLMSVKDMSSVRLLDQISDAPRKGYKHNEAGLERFICQVRS